MLAGKETCVGGGDRGADAGGEGVEGNAVGRVGRELEVSCEDVFGVAESA